jgi:hypothetical protein
MVVPGRGVARPVYRRLDDTAPCRTTAMPVRNRIPHRHVAGTLSAGRAGARGTRTGATQTLKPRVRSWSRPSSVILSGPHGGSHTQLMRKSLTRPPPGPPVSADGSGPRSRRSAGRPPR